MPLSYHSLTSLAARSLEVSPDNVVVVGSKNTLAEVSSLFAENMNVFVPGATGACITLDQRLGAV